MIFINQNSFTIAAGALLLALLAFLRRGGLDLGKALALAALLLGLSLTYFLFSPGRSATARAAHKSWAAEGRSCLSSRVPFDWPAWR